MNHCPLKQTNNGFSFSSETEQLSFLFDTFQLRKMSLVSKYLHDKGKIQVFQFEHQGAAIKRVHNTIRWIYHYPVGKCSSIHPVGSIIYP